MKSAIFKGIGDIVVESRPHPKIIESTDALVRVVMTCVCGTDLWYYRGISEHVEGPIGHEFIGIVEDKGGEVSNVRVGDLVISPFAFSDGSCPHCRAGFQTACVNGGFFGTGAPGDGGQAEFVRVPYADGTLVVVEGREFSDGLLASLLTLTDVMGTGYHAAISADVQRGDTVGVVGDGAVGLSGVLSAKLLGADRIILLGGNHGERTALGLSWGATDIISSRGSEAVEEVRVLTDNIGVDAVLECVGTKEASDTAFSIARPGAIVGRVGVPHDVNIDAGATFYRNIGMRGGPAPVRSYVPQLLEAVLSGEINPGQVFDRAFDLDHVADAYAAMDQRSAIKSLIKVSSI